mgnify:CR=1 FL=1
MAEMASRHIERSVGCNVGIQESQVSGPASRGRAGWAHRHPARVEHSGRVDELPHAPHRSNVRLRNALADRGRTERIPSPRAADHARQDGEHVARALVGRVKLCRSDSQERLREALVEYERREQERERRVESLRGGRGVSK